MINKISGVRYLQSQNQSQGQAQNKSKIAFGKTKATAKIPGIELTEYLSEYREYKHMKALVDLIKVNLVKPVSGRIKICQKVFKSRDVALLEYTPPSPTHYESFTYKSGDSIEVKIIKEEMASDNQKLFEQMKTSLNIRRRKGKRFYIAEPKAKPTWFKQLNVIPHE